MSVIHSVHGRQILDSRGRPTVEVEVALSSGVTARASVPSGASTGTYEAHELRDGDEAIFNGRGVLSAVGHVNDEIERALYGHDVSDQAGCDGLLRDLDGTGNLSRLGANAVLGTSLAVCRASAHEAGIPLYRRIQGLAQAAEASLPRPMVNIFSGGLHAGRAMSIQDLLAIPVGATTMLEAMHVVARVRDAATSVCAERGIPTLLADEGGLSPGCETGRQALELMVEAIEQAELAPGHDVGIAIDVAAATFYDTKKALYQLDNQSLTTEQMIETVASWVEDFPIISIEDPLDEEDWDGWAQITHQLGDRVRIIGDDLFTTNEDRFTRGVRDGCANSVLVKVNQNGTLTGTFGVLAAARAAGYASVVSARSGETEDDFLADLAVGSGAGQIKVGSLRNSDRLAKYNQLVRIAEDQSLEMAAFPTPIGAPAPGTR